jgi:hypothetical protein
MVEIYLVVGSEQSALVSPILRYANNELEAKAIAEKMAKSTGKQAVIYRGVLVCTPTVEWGEFKEKA